MITRKKHSTENPVESGNLFVENLLPTRNQAKPSRSPM